MSPLDDDPPSNPGGRYYSEDDFERAVHARMREKQQEEITESLRRSQQTLESRIAEMSREVQDRIQELRAEVATRATEFQHYYDQLHDELEERRRVLRLSDLSVPQMGKFAELMRFWDAHEDALRSQCEFWNNYHAIMPVIAQRYTARSITAEAHKEREESIGKKAAILGAIASGVLAAGTMLVFIWEQLAHHWKA